MAAQVDRLGRGQSATTADMVVKEEAQPQHPAWAQAFGPRQDETHRMDDVRGDRPEPLPLDQRFAHQSEGMMFQIAQAAMDQLGRGGGCAAGKVALLQQQHARAAPGGIAGNATAIYPTADDGKVVDIGCWRLAHAP